MKVFGSPCYFHVPKQLRVKLDAKSLPGIFVGYEELKRSFKVIPLHDPDRVVFSRDVICDESVVVQRYLENRVIENLTDFKQADKVEFEPAPHQPQQPRNSVKQQPDMKNLGFKTTRSGKVYNRMDPSDIENTGLNAALHGIVEIDNGEPKTLHQALKDEESEK